MKKLLDFVMYVGVKYSVIPYEKVTEIQEQTFNLLKSFADQSLQLLKQGPPFDKPLPKVKPAPATEPGLTAAEVTEVVDYPTPADFARDFHAESQIMEPFSRDALAEPESSPLFDEIAATSFHPPQIVIPRATTTESLEMPEPEPSEPSLQPGEPEVQSEAPAELKPEPEALQPDLAEEVGFPEAQSAVEVVEQAVVEEEALVTAIDYSATQESTPEPYSNVAPEPLGSEEQISNRFQGLTFEQIVEVIREEEREKLILKNPTLQQKDWSRGLFKNWLDMAIRSRLRELGY